MNLGNVKKVYKKLVPIYVRKPISIILHNMKRYLGLIKTLQYFSDENIFLQYDEKASSEIKYSLDFLKKTKFTVPTFFMEKTIIYSYMNRKIKVYKDVHNQLPYIKRDGKKLYFKRGMTKREVVNLFNGFSLEQDDFSPHRYFSRGEYFFGTINKKNSFKPRGAFGVCKDDVVVDMGAAEGNFSLSVVDLASKLYIFESDPGWCEALQATFKPYKAKVEIVNKYISDLDDLESITLDSFFKNNKKPPNFIKIDIEGFEEKALDGGINTIKSSSYMKIALCTYHRQQDANLFYKTLVNLGFDVSFTDGYMFFLDKLAFSHFLRKGVLRAVKKS